jgi:hypothetical protein
MVALYRDDQTVEELIRTSRAASSTRLAQASLLDAGRAYPAWQTKARCWISEPDLIISR